MDFLGLRADVLSLVRMLQASQHLNQVVPSAQIPGNYFWSARLETLRSFREVLGVLTPFPQAVSGNLLLKAWRNGVWFENLLPFHLLKLLSEPATFWHGHSKPLETEYPW